MLFPPIPPTLFIAPPPTYVQLHIRGFDYQDNNDFKNTFKKTQCTSVEIVEIVINVIRIML